MVACLFFPVHFRVRLYRDPFVTSSLATTSIDRWRNVGGSLIQRDLYLIGKVSELEPGHFQIENANDQSQPSLQKRAILYWMQHNHPHIAAAMRNAQIAILRYDRFALEPGKRVYHCHNWNAPQMRSSKNVAYPEQGADDATHIRFGYLHGVYEIRDIRQGQAVTVALAQPFPSLEAERIFSPDAPNLTPEQIQNRRNTLFVCQPRRVAFVAFDPRSILQKVLIFSRTIQRKYMVLEEGVFAKNEQQ